MFSFHGACRQAMFAPTQGTEVEQRLAFAEDYRMLNTRIGVFINIPVDACRRALQKRLLEIGRPLEQTESHT